MKTPFQKKQEANAQILDWLKTGVVVGIALFGTSFLLPAPSCILGYLTGLGVIAATVAASALAWLWVYLSSDEMKPREDSREYFLGGGWGDHIEWMKCGDSVAGHKHTRPRKGDVLVCEMISGRIGRYVFIDVEYCSDPTDMFFALVRFHDYKD